MAKLANLLNQVEEIAYNPRAMLDNYLKQGKKVIGCFPIYTPAELVHAAGIIPLGLWGGQVNPSLAGQYAPIFICSIMRSCLEFGMLGKYKGISAVIMPILCDTFRGMSGAWRVGVKDIPLIALIQPQNREVEGASEFLTAEYEQVKIQLEELAGKKITASELEKSIEIYNLHNKAMREFCQLANKHLDVITPKLRHSIMKSAHFTEKTEHLKLMHELIEELKKLPEHNWLGKKVVLTGITAEPSELLDIFAQNGIAVVGDDLAQESRQFRTDIPPGDSPLERLANQWFERQACATVHETTSSRGELLTQMVAKERADGIINCLMSFCDVEEYEYPMLAQKAAQAQIPYLRLDIDQSTENSGQARTKLQTFVEML